ncbi:MAG TPA: ATP-dependent RecD-like DNA helicase [Bacteroidota bacterium]|nr:ATP-dependent RecD-like DNA helicase [Bacteroidota bacterium]
MGKSQARDDQQTASALSVTGSLSRIIYRNNENGYLIGILKTTDGNVTIVGYMVDPREGDEYSLTGKWTTHAKYGKQFAVDSYEVKAPTSVHGIEEYLASGLIKGVGPSLASRIVHEFGSATLDIMNDDPRRLLEVPGVGERKLAAIITATQSMREMQDVMLYLKSQGIGTGYAIRIYKTYGREAIRIVRENPFQLIEDIPGIGFHIADGIAQKVGVESNSSYRIEAGIRFVLEDACRSSGHCYLPREDVVQRAAQLLIADESMIDTAIDLCAQNGVIVNDGNNIFPMRLYDAKDDVVHKIEQLLRKGSKTFDESKLLHLLKQIEHRHGITLGVRQRDAVVHTLLEPLTIITGGPGTGKTLCVNGIIEMADELSVDVLLCAPTGRAAKRLSELTGREAKTIHRLLEYEPQSGQFRRSNDMPLEAKLIIVDEVSMVDLPLFAALIDAVRPDAQLALVGDVDQLPSVGPGQVLRDLIDSKRLPVVRLDTIFRQAEESSIISNSHRMNHGEAPECDGDFEFIEETDPKKIQSTIVRLCSSILPHNRQYDPFDDIQVLSPMHNAFAGVRELNKELQQTLNPHGRLCWQGSERKFLLGDKVMQMKNNYDKEIYNGDIGRVSGVQKDDGVLFVDFYGRQIEYAFDQLDELTLAYAMTIHKSQGSEFKAVILPVTMSHYIMLQRNLFYTAVTRAREHLVLVGDKRALAIALRNADVRERHTMLRRKLIDAL